VIALVPAATPVARPLELIVATELVAEAQVAVEVTIPIEPSLYDAVAVNCSVSVVYVLALGGDTAMEVTVLACTVRVTPALVTPLRAAVTTLEPPATPVASPLELTVATDWVADVQVAVELTFAVEPSLYVAVAVNCWVAPTRIVALEGDTAMEVRAAATLRVALPLIPLRVADTVVEPASIPFANPLALTVATDWLAAAQVAEEVMSAVEPSL
jgi:hypothetical protein